ncbi:histidine phosphatase family protein [Rhodococcus aerolatus]
MTGRLLLVRHGESTANVAHRLETRPPGAPLTERGQAQARALVEVLAGHAVTAVHASVATRAQQTAAPLAAALGLGVAVEEGTHETDAGELEGRADEAAHERFTEVYARWLAGERGARVPGGESAAEILARYLPVVERLRPAGPGDVVLVSHGAVVRLVAAALTGVDPRFALDRRLDNTERIELAPRADGGWECLRWGAHTPPFVAPPPDEEPPDAL